MKEDFIKNTPLFSELGDDERRAISKRMRLEQYNSDEFVFVRGGESDALYLIKEGWIKLSGESGSVVASLGPGSLIGEADFFLGRPYMMTAQASGKAEVWSLNQEAMVGLISERPELGLRLGLALGKAIIQFRQHLIDRLAETPFLQDLSPREQNLVAQYLSPQRYRAGETIYRSGDLPTGLFFIEKGTVRLLGDTDDDYTELTVYEAFGEMAVISGKPHTNTAQAVGEVILWQLSPADFQALTEVYPSIKTSLSRNLRARLSGADQVYALAVLRRIPLFENLSREALNDIVRFLLLRYVPAGEFVFNQGDPGDAMYIVDAGVVNVIFDSPGKPNELRRRFNEGDFFGETALLTGTTRTFTAQAVADTHLWCLYRTDFDNLLVKHPQISAALSQALRERFSAGEDYAVEPHLKKIALLGGLSRAQLDELSSRFQPRRYQGGSAIYVEGSSGDEMYFIERGQIELWATTAQGPVLLETLSQSDYFGEIALLSGRAHHDTAYALVETHIWALTKADFDDFLQRYPNLGVILSRILSERMEATLNRLRGAPAQRSLPAPPGYGPGPASRPVYIQPASSGPSYGGPAAPSRPTMAMPPVPVRPVAPPSGSRPLPVPGIHSQFTQPLPPTTGGPSVHSQHTMGMPPVSLRPARPATPVPPQSRPPVQQEVSRSDRPRRKVKRKRASTQDTGRPPSPPQLAPGPINPGRERASQRSKPVPVAARSLGPGPSSQAPARPSRRGFSFSQLIDLLGGDDQPIDDPSMQPRSISNRRLSRYNNSISVWFARRTLGAKLRLLAIAIAIVWICGIMAPSLIINALASTFSDNGALPGDSRSPLQQMREDGAVAAMGVFPFVETATPTPTETAIPTETPTQTPTTTGTPLPTYTATPTLTPTPTDTATPIFTPTPTDTPTRSAPRATAAPTSPPDTPTPAPTPTPDVDFRVKSVRQLTPCENQSKHHIFVKVEDANGQGINGVPLKVQWSPVPDGSVIATTETKHNLLSQLEPGHIDFAMFKGSYTVEVTSGTSEVAGPVTPDYGTNEACGENAVANSLYHISFEIIFQRTY